MTAGLDDLSQLLEKTRAQGADACDAVMFETVDVSASRRLRKPEGLERAESKALGLRAFCGARQAIASTTDCSPHALERLVERVVAMAKSAPPDPDSSLAPQTLYPKTLPELELLDKEEPTAAWLGEQCAAAEEAALAVKGITNSEGTEAAYGQSRIHLAVLHKGGAFAKSYAASHCSISVSVIAGENQDMQRDYDFTSARHRADLLPAAQVGRNAAERTLKRMHPRKPSTARVPVMFDPRVGRGLLSVLAGAISGSAIVRGASFLKDSMGQQIFRKGISIVDDPHIRRGLGSKPFDGEGVANRKLALVEDGKLQSWLLDMRTANRLKLQTTGHAARGIASTPSPSSTNLYMENGHVTPEFLRKEMGTGLFVTETFGGGINTITGDYSQGASGFWVENGEISYPVAEITIAGKLQDMLASLTPANDLEFRYAANAPTFRVDALTVAGA